MRTGSSRDIIIIGGGVTGLSIALHLRMRHAGRITILERHHIGAGQSGHAAGIVRCLVAHSGVAAMLAHSLRFFNAFEEQWGEKLAVWNAGFLLVNRMSQAGFLNAVVSSANEAGSSARRISREDALELQPGIRADPDDIFAFEPGAVWVDPMLAIRTLANTARLLDIEIMEGCAVLSILKSGSRLEGVETSQGTIACGTVVIGTAVWGAAQLQTLGITVPVYPHRAEMAFFAPPAGSAGRVVRILSDARTTIYLRPVGAAQMFVGWREGDRITDTDDLVPADPDNYWQSAHHETLAELSRRLSRTLPFMSEGVVLRTYACVYDYTPDAMPILDRADTIDGLYFSLGYSGGGFSLSPWVGAVMAEFIVNGVKSPEMQLLRLKRFEERQVVSWANTAGESA